MPTSPTNVATAVRPRDLGAIVRSARLAAGLSQTELGKRIGASRFWVAEFEAGKPRAEIGLALKAMHTLGLVITVEPREASRKRPAETVRGRAAQQRPLQPVDISGILARAAMPVVKR